MLITIPMRLQGAALTGYNSYMYIITMLVAMRLQEAALAFKREILLVLHNRTESHVVRRVHEHSRVWRAGGVRACVSEDGGPRWKSAASTAWYCGWVRALRIVLI